MAFSDMIGKQVPSVTFHTQQQGKWVDVTTDELFKGKSSIIRLTRGIYNVFITTGRYNELATEFAKLGVDDIVRVSVNDTFVMNAWAKDQDQQCDRDSRW
ncbi:MAG: redoxin family protein [Moraxella osloensis]